MVNCNRASFLALWRSLPARDRDDEWLERWRRLRIGMRTRVFRPEPAGTSPVPFDTAVKGDRDAAFRDELGEEAVRHVFRERFGRWWRDSAAEHLAALPGHLDVSARRAGLSDRLDALQTFFAVDPATLVSLPVVLVGADRRFSGATHGEYRDDVVYVETLMGETADARTGTIAHELAHLVYGRASRARRAEIRDWFVTHESTLAIPAYALFNEAIATAFGNGLVERSLMGEPRFERLLVLPEALYADTYIDAAGRSAMPLLDEYLADGKALDSAFVDRYIAALGERLGARLTDQAFWLRVMVLATSSPSLWSLADNVAERVRTGSLLQDDISQGCSERCLLQRYPEVPGIVAVTTDKLDTLAELVTAEDLASMRRLSVVHGHVAYAVRRSERSLLFVAVGTDEAGAAAAVEELLDFGQIFEGPLL